LACQLVGQKGVPFLPWADIQRRQSRRIRRLVHYAYRTVPHYRETMSRLGLGPDQIRSVEDLGKLPLVERIDLQRDPEGFLSRAVDRSACLEIQGSGSVRRIDEFRPDLIYSYGSYVDMLCGDWRGNKNGGHRRIVPGRGTERQSFEKQLLEHSALVFGSQLTANVEFVDDIPTAPSGKFEAVKAKRPEGPAV
jgi:hypothetical protein